MRLRSFAMCSLFALGCGLPAHPGTGTHTNTVDLDPGWKVGTFSLTERNGDTITDESLRGKVWIASFVFTRCTGPCPAVSSTVARLQSELKDVPADKLKLVTFTVDPKRDDLASLREYADARKADPKRWLFLTGEEETIHKLLREQFKQAIGRNEGPDVKPGDEFAHSTRLMVIDRDGVIRGIYAGLPDERLSDAEAKADFDANLARLKKRVSELLK